MGIPRVVQAQSPSNAEPFGIRLLDRARAKHVGDMLFQNGPPEGSMYRYVLYAWAVKGFLYLLFGGQCMYYIAAWTLWAGNECLNSATETPFPKYPTLWMMLNTHTWRLLCSSYLVVTCSFIGKCNILVTRKRTTWKSPGSAPSDPNRATVVKSFAAVRRRPRLFPAETTISEEFSQQGRTNRLQGFPNNQRPQGFPKNALIIYIPHAELSLSGHPQEGNPKSE